MPIINTKVVLILAISIILVINATNPAIAQKRNGPSKPSELNLTISPDRQEICLNQNVIIYFNITNNETDDEAIARDINFEASISKSLQFPSKEMRIGPDKRNSKNANLELYSDFYSHEQETMEYVKISPDGILDVHISELKPKQKLVIVYKTIYVGDIKSIPEQICSKRKFEWRVEKNAHKDLLISTINVVNNKPVIDLFSINISPEYNITCWDKQNCTIFKHSNVFFKSRYHDPDIYHNSTLNASYIDNIIETNSLNNKIENGSKLTELGTHQFRIEVYDSHDVNSNNSIHLVNVVDLIENHRSLAFSESMYTALIISVIILAIIFMVIRRVDRYQPKNLSDKPRIRTTQTIGLSIAIIIIELVLYYYYSNLNGYYKTLIWLESASIIIAFCIFIILVLCDDKSCQILKGQDFFKIAFGMASAAFLYHYFLPDILSIKIVYTLLLAAVFELMLLIINNRNKIDNIMTQNKSNGSISMIAIIALEIAIFSAITYFAIPYIVFKPRFKIIELLIIEIMEVSMLIMIAAYGHSPKKIAAFAKSELTSWLDLISKLRGSS